jgi:LuxR family transcriptional regulator, maltose regulon positive regulatory protein
MQVVACVGYDKPSDARFLTRIVWHWSHPMAMLNLTKTADELLDAGFHALAEGKWQDAFGFFQRAVELDETARACEGLAAAAWWLDEASVVFHQRERAYHLYQQQDDRLGAARAATGIALDHYLYRGDLAITNGWLQRARRLLEGNRVSAERGWLAMWEAHILLFEHNNIATVKAMCSEITGLAQALSLVDLETLALALEGLALVSSGAVPEGMRRLDEATTVALAGEVSDPDAIVTVCCYMIYACERVRDFRRAVEWCEKAETVARRWAYRSMFAFCRCHYAAVLLWRGSWSRAEEELTRATHELMATRPGWIHESIVRLAELRRRQGRPDEASSLFGLVSTHPHMLLGRAEMALDAGDARTAADLVDRFLRRIPGEDRTERAVGLELAVRVHLALGAFDAAQSVLAELDATVQLVGTEPVRAGAHHARGLVCAAANDLDTARRCFEDAIDLFERNGAPFETALARLELARVQAATDRRVAAVAEAQVAYDALQRLGARQALGAAASLLQSLDMSLSEQNEDRSAIHLTRREIEVLRLVARGASNHEIAETLFISVRTVERHVSTIYRKIDVEGPAARAKATVYAFESGLAPAPDT